MPANTLSLQFQIYMAAMAAFFWVLGWIPGVNVVTNFIYWVIWLGVFFYKYLPLLKSIAKAGTAIGVLQVKIWLISGFAFVLGEIPFISWGPWSIISNWWINRLINEMAAKVKKITKDTRKLGRVWQKHQKAHPFNRTQPQPKRFSDGISQPT